MNASSRREFLADVSRATVAAAVGTSLASELGLAPAFAGEAPDKLDFGSVEPLVRLMQETPANKLLPALVAKLSSGTDLRQLTAAAALANARTFGGEDYIGFHTMMALSPAYQMSRELSSAQQALPVFKVLYRNTNRIQEFGGPAKEVLRPVKPGASGESQPGGEAIRDAVRKKDTKGAEQMLAAIAQRSPEDAFNSVLLAVQDHSEVHRVVMPYRAWDLLDVVGRQHAGTMLRQSVHYCVRGSATPGPACALLTQLLDQHKLLDQKPGTRTAEDKWVDQLSQTIFKSTAAQAAEAVASALAEGFAPAVIGEALSLAANQLVLRDHGRPPQAESAGKPTGSVHGDSIGVHACDSANAWRNMARVANARNTFACLILGAHQVAHDRIERGGDFLKWEALPVKWHLDRTKSTDAAALLHEAEEAIRGNLQSHAAAIVHRYGELGHAPRPVFDLLLRYAISEDGALHAEKYYRTASDEFASTRSAFRWRQLVALARVTASEFGRPAPGVAEAKELLKV
ncbi:MAG: hypothetical protein FD161_3718 [Limisphaerales bacterium]|nr:MAG: hypothetical protein FD161_3718 [Limisphaerales bacterium]KAG0507524.1 MAG: hypothetical protein E1N63_3315 [Limisphaerales bacterium]TXT48976.1 MAG: hypothetical protein FD140_3358 [Limisphaerales bacterium]